MLQPVPMAKVAIVGAKPRLPETIETLHRLNLLHIEDFTGGEDRTFDLGSPLPGGSKVSERLLRVRGVLKGAQMAPPKEARPFTLENLKALEGRLKEIEDDVSRLVEERGKVQDEIKALQEQTQLLSRITNLQLPTRLLHGYRSLATATGFVATDADLSGLRGVHADADWIESQEAEGRFIAVFVPKSAERALQDALAKLSFQPVEVPTFDAPPATQHAQLETRRAELESRLAQLDGKLANIREKHAAAFFALDEYLSIEADKATAPVRFRTTANSFMIEGWIPHDAYAKLESSLARATKNGVFVTRLQRAATSHGAAKSHHGKEDGHGEAHGAAHKGAEDVPVQLKNFNRAGPYELLTDTYSRPKYTELDPTLFMYIGFPIFFGMMLGDIGYGLVLFLLVATGVFNKVYQVFGFQSRWHLNRIFLHCAVSSIVFGILYSEFFGLELMGRHGILSHYETHLGPIPFPLVRLEYVKLLLALSLLIGVVHLFIGLVIGIRNAAAEHGMKEAMKHRGSWLCILLAVTLAGIAIVPDTLHLNESPAHEEPAAGPEPVAHEEKIIAHPQPFYYAAIAFLVVGVVLLVMGEGGIALLELPTVLSNLLSYTRLVAIGLSGVGIALAGNKVAAMLMAGGTGGLIGGIIVAILFHLMGVALGVLGPALHALRLHYVEFFTKFYTGGGTPYTPFGAQRKYTVQEVKQA